MLALHPRSTPRRRGTPNSTLSELIGLGRPAQNGPVKPYVQLLDRIYIDVPPSHIKPQESGSDREAFFQRYTEILWSILATRLDSHGARRSAVEHLQGAVAP